METIRENTSKEARRSYGPEVLDVEDDISSSTLSSRTSTYLNQHVNISNERIEAIEILTKSQSCSQVWNEERKKRITASNFGYVIKRKPTIPVCKLVEQFLYKGFKSNESTRFGLQKERSTNHEYILKRAEEGMNVAVEASGLIISQVHKFLGGSPDGVVFVNGRRSGLIEVKDLLKNKKINLSRAAQFEKTFCLDHDGEKLKLKTSHNYYYQCQGLMYVCDLPWIDFVVRCVNPYQLHIERISRNEQLWETWLPKLKAFYERALLPELVCPRHEKLPGIREPGTWFVDSKKPVRRRTTATSRKEAQKTTNTCSSAAVRQSNSRRAASTRPKLLGRHIKHRWTLSDDSIEKEWFTGTVISLISGTDGCLDAEYEVFYDKDNETYIINHLVQDFKEGSVVFLDV